MGLRAKVNQFKKNLGPPPSQYEMGGISSNRVTFCGLVIISIYIYCLLVFLILIYFNFDYLCPLLCESWDPPVKMSRGGHIRRENPALQFNHSLRFHSVNNDCLLAYSKSTADGADTVLAVVNLDPHHTQQGWLELPLDEFAPESKAMYQMHDLLTGARFLWQGSRNFVELDPRYSPAHIFRLRRHVRTERDFDYFV